MNMLSRLPLHLLVSVGSRHNKVCSVGAFARAEAKALESVFSKVTLLEPTEENAYPECSQVSKPDVILFHSPSLHDRLTPWNALKNAWILRKTFPKALFISMIHEYSEAPTSWKLRQNLLLKLSHGAIANSHADHSLLKPRIEKILRSRLGPTLFSLELLQLDERGFRETWETVRRDVALEFNLPEEEKWILHPGLLTPGKGIDFLHQLIPSLGKDTRLILMGGLGPKESDKRFAAEALSDLRKKLSSRFTFIEGPTDETYKKVLFAADLVLLPYNNGLSERRSSFLSAMSCAANVWTTLGPFSDKMELSQSGSFSVPVEQWVANDKSIVQSLSIALSESPELHLVRRRKNFHWGKRFSWDTRAEQIAIFVSGLMASFSSNRSSVETLKL